jgi:hypothetical protein
LPVLERKLQRLRSGTRKNRALEPAAEWNAVCSRSLAMLEHFFRTIGAALAVSLIASRALAGDFVSDLASCAKAPISAASFAGNAKKAAEFVINHGECVPMVVGGDVLLYGTTAGFMVLQNSGTLPKGAQACVDATLGQASRPVAKVLQSFVDQPPMSSMLSSDGKTQLIKIAQGETNATLYQVPGIGLVMDHVSCACAVSSAGIDINALKSEIKNVVGSIDGCKNLVSGLVSGLYNVGKAATGAAKDFVNSVGCTLGLGGCSGGGPPFFCTGYFKLRDSGRSREDIVKIFPSLFGPEYINDESQKCEQKYAAAILAAQQAKAEAEATAKAQQLGAANALGFALRWGHKCYDQECKAALARLANLYTAEIQNPDVIKENPDFGVLKAKMDQKYGAFAQLAIAASKKRTRDNPGAPIDKRLLAFDCKPYLGIARQSFCKDQQGLGVCRTYVDQRQWDACRLQGVAGAYSAAPALAQLMRRAGCIPEGSPGTARLALPGKSRIGNLTVQCLSPLARAQCNAYRAGGSPVTCAGPTEVVVFDRARLGNQMLAPRGPITTPPPSRPAQRLPGR